MSTTNPRPEMSAPETSSDDWLSIDEAAAVLARPSQAVRQMLRDGDLIADRSTGSVRIPAALIEDGQTSRYLRGILTSLRDGGYSNDEALRWLLTEDESLGGTPAWAMHHQLHREVSRRAQAMAF